MAESFLSLIPISFIGVCLFLGVCLRRFVPFMQNFIVPASIGGGLIGFATINIFDVSLSSDMFSEITVLLFNLSFISLGLTGVDKRINTSKVVSRGIMWMVLINTALISGQGLVGFLTWEATNFVIGAETYDGFGFLLPHGFVQGPGQAMALGTVWEKTFGVTDAITIALTFSAVGFLVASLVGVPLARWGLKKGAAHFQAEDMCKNYLNGIRKADDVVSCGRETTFSGNIDTFSLHLALVGVSYLLTIGFCYILDIFVAGTIFSELVFGIFFVWGMLIAMAVRKAIIMLGYEHIIDNNVQGHITGIFVDFLVTGTILSINIAVVMKYIFQLIMVCLAGTLYTLFLTVFFGRRLKEYGLERLLIMFGCGTGTIPSGLALLRIVDQHFKTSAAFESGAQQFFLMFTMDLILIFALAFPGSGFSVWEFAAIDFGAVLICIICLRVFKLWGPRQF